MQSFSTTGTDLSVSGRYPGNLVFGRYRPGLQHVILLLSVKCVQLIQISPQLEHPCSLGTTPLLTRIGHKRKVTIGVILSLDK